MKLVQALHWLKHAFEDNGSEIRGRLHAILTDSEHGAAIKQDLVEAFSHLPSWMQDFLLSLRGVSIVRRAAKYFPQPAALPLTGAQASAPKRGR